MEKHSWSLIRKQINDCKGLLIQKKGRTYIIKKQRKEEEVKANKRIF